MRQDENQLRLNTHWTYISTRVDQTRDYLNSYRAFGRYNFFDIFAAIGTERRPLKDHLPKVGRLPRRHRKTPSSGSGAAPVIWRKPRHFACIIHSNSPPHPLAASQPPQPKRTSVNRDHFVSLFSCEHLRANATGGVAVPKLVPTAVIGNGPGPWLPTRFYALTTTLNTLATRHHCGELQFYFHHRGFKYLLQFRSKFLFSQRNSESPRDSKRLLYCFLSLTREVVIVKSELQAARKDKTKKKKERLRLKKSASFSRTNPKWKRTFAELVKIRSVRWWRAFAVKVTRSISIAPSFSLSKKGREKKNIARRFTRAALLWYLTSTERATPSHHDCCLSTRREESASVRGRE